MAERIELNVDAIRDRAGQMEQLKNKQGEVMSKMTNLVLNLNEVFKGEAQNAFVSKYIGMQTSFNNLSEAIHQYAELLTNACDTMESKDKDIMNRINAI